MMILTLCSQYGMENSADVQQNRQHLYNRYLYDSNPDSWAVGLTNKPEFLIVGI